MKKVALTISVVLAASCSTGGKMEATEVAFDDQATRLEMMEATLRVLDENPEYVDEFYLMAVRHDRTYDRFLANTAVAVEDPVRAERVARYLVAHPPGLRRVMIETLDAAQRRPAAQRAIVDAIEARASVAAEYLVEHPKELAAISEEIVRQALDDPNTADRMRDLVSELVD